MYAKKVLLQAFYATNNESLSEDSIRVRIESLITVLFNGEILNNF